MKKITLTRLEALDYVSSESLNTLCANLTFAGHGLKKLLFTGASAGEGEGTTHVALRVLQTLAARGQRAVLVDCDLRSSTLSSRYGADAKGELAGLAQYLSGAGKAEDILYETNMPGAYLVPQGRAVDQPVALLRSEKLAALLDELAQQFDVVLVDTPPVGLVVDAAEVASCCDGIVLVCEYGRTRRRSLALAKRQLKASGCAILGCVINKVTYDTLSSRLYFNHADYERFSSHLNPHSDQ